MLSEMIFEKNGSPSMYVCTRFLTDAENTISLTYTSTDIARIDQVRQNAVQALENVRILNP